jgi:hypothetical protein
MKEELKTILAEFAESGWDLIDEPVKEYRCGVDNRITLIKVIEQADEQ